MALGRKRASGAFYRIPLAHGRFGYGRLLPSKYVAIYDLVTREPLADLDVIDARSVLWRVSVHDRMFARWIHIGNRDVERELARPVERFMQNPANYLDCTIFDDAGSSRSVKPEECIGLESAGAWDPEALEVRILDNLEGRENADEVAARVRLAPGTRERIAQMVREKEI